MNQFYYYFASLVNFNKLKKNTLLLICLPFITLLSNAQTFVMSNGGSASSCSGTFLDPGGAGNYAGGTSDWTYTICNPTPGEPVYLSFNSFDLWSNACVWGASVDELLIYNGPSTASPLIGIFSDNNGSPSNIYGTSGCITVMFRREDFGGLFCDENAGNPGWNATITCTPPPSDGSDCFASLPFCTELTYDFPNSTGSSAPSGPNYGCLSAQPNPIWYYMQVDQGGTFDIDLEQTSGPNGSGFGIDVDFALYGPFSDLSLGCSSIMNGSSAPIQCSYNEDYVEQIGIGVFGGDPGWGGSTPPAAVAGQIYVLLLTNFDDEPGYINFNQSGGTGIADCSIVTPCDMTDLTAIPSACNPSDNLYTLNGQVTFINAPVSGTLTISSSCGGNQVFNAPFTSPQSYSFPNLTSDGANCTVTAIFSDDVTCEIEQDYTAPSACTPVSCTITAGNSGPICSGETANLTATTVTDATYSWSGPSGFSSLGQNPINVPVPSTPGTYDYTVTATPLVGDPCVSVTTITVNAIPTADAGNYSDVCNTDADVVLVGTPIGGTFSGTGVTGNNFDPSVGTQTITYDYVDGNGCEATDNVVITVNTAPIVSAGSYDDVCIDANDVALIGTPAGGTFTGTGVTGNNFDPTVGTQTVTYDYTELGCSASATATITVNNLPTVTIGSYPTVCADANDIPLVGSPAGGIYTGNGITGTNFDPSAGTQTITYEYTDANGCSESDQTVITINPLPIIEAGIDQTVCIGSEVTLFGAGGVSYIWDNNGIDGVPFTPSEGVFTFTVTGTDANGCTNTDQVIVTALPTPIANISSNTTSGNAPLEVTFFNDSQFGSTYNWEFGNGGNATTGNLNNVTQTYLLEGEYEVILIASNGICDDADTMYIIVLPELLTELLIPNVFTPNGDGANDVFFITATNAVSMNVQIYNRWGENMHSINSLTDSWDGRTANGNEANDGVYFFKYEVVGANGEVFKGHGNVSLVR